MTEIDELKVIKAKEDEKAKELSDLRARKEKELAEKRVECSERAKSIENQIINDYNKGIEDIKETENKKLVDALDTQKARAEVMKIDLKWNAMEEYAHNLILNYIKNSE
ncbi:MAG: hypothetical protein QXZ44_05830 [Ferroplasma sp.]